MKIQIICVGKLKEKYLKDGVLEYSKRLSRFCSFEVIELNDEKIPQNPSLAECNKVIEAEGEQILKKINKDSYIIALCVEGKSLTSEEFAQKFSKITLAISPTIFIFLPPFLSKNKAYLTPIFDSFYDN